jgi:hypothetical protein
MYCGHKWGHVLSSQGSIWSHNMVTHVLACCVWWFVS